jgi:hypothetical protein
MDKVGGTFGTQEGDDRNMSKSVLTQSMHVAVQNTPAHCHTHTHSHSKQNTLGEALPETPTKAQHSPLSFKSESNHMLSSKPLTVNSALKHWLLLFHKDIQSKVTILAPVV